MGFALNVRRDWALYAVLVGSKLVNSYSLKDLGKNPMALVYSTATSEGHTLWQPFATLCSGTCFRQALTCPRKKLVPQKLKKPLGTNFFSCAIPWSSSMNSINATICILFHDFGINKGACYSEAFSCLIVAKKIFRDNLHYFITKDENKKISKPPTSTLSKI